jgi:hypothetical protein
MVRFSKYCRKISAMKPEIGEPIASTFRGFINFIIKSDNFGVK